MTKSRIRKCFIAIHFVCTRRRRRRRRCRHRYFGLQCNLANDGGGGGKECYAVLSWWNALGCRNATVRCCRRLSILGALLIPNTTRRRRRRWRHGKPLNETGIDRIYCCVAGTKAKFRCCFVQPPHTWDVGAVQFKRINPGICNCVRAWSVCLTKETQL